MVKKKNKMQLSIPLVITSLIAMMFMAFSLMCIPCILAAYPSVGLFFAFVGAIAILIAPNSWFLLMVGILLIAFGLLLQLMSRNKKCA